jgi:hypothetical protein
MNQIENVHSLNKSVSTYVVALTLSLLTALVLTVVLGGYVDLKSTFAKLSDVENYNVGLLANVASADTVVIDKWHPGIYAKIEDWQLQNPKQMEMVYQELADTPQLRGIKVIAKWGRYETYSTTTNTSTYDFSQIDAILAKLATLDNKHLILAVPWREFKSSLGASEVLPNDLRGGQLWSDDPDWVHTDYDYMWAYKMSNKPGQYAYNLKLWDPVVKSRLDAFLAALAQHVDGNPNFNHITATESSIGNPVIPFVAGEGTELQEDGQIEVLRMMKRHFVNSYVIPDFNYSRQHVADSIPILVAEGMGLGTSDSNYGTGLNTTSTPPGILTYFPTLSGQIILAPEIQSGNYISSSYDSGSVADYPSYESLYKRVRDDLKANYVVMQRNFPFWLGNATTTSVLSFLQTYPDIVNDTTGAGGLNHIKPAMLNVDVPPPIAPDLSFNASPTEVYSGDSAVLSWSATNSTACEALGSWSGTKSLEGIELINNVASTSSYSLTCTGTGGSVTKEVSIVVKADTVPPSIPNNLSYINVNTDSVTLNWSVATDNIAVAGYNLYRDGVKINTLTDTTFTDSALTSGSSYTYTVTALDGAGNESGHSTSVSVTTTAVAPFEISSYSATNLTRNSATINVSLSMIGNVTIKYSRISSNLNLTKSSFSLKKDHAIALGSLDKDKTYYYQIVATDESGNTVTSPVASFKTRK